MNDIEYQQQVTDLFNSETIRNLDKKITDFVNGPELTPDGEELYRKLRAAYMRSYRKKHPEYLQKEKLRVIRKYLKEQQQTQQQTQQERPRTDGNDPGHIFVPKHE